MSDWNNDTRRNISSAEANRRLTPTGDIEGRFRREVRDALDLDLFTRDDQILDRIRELARIERRRRKTPLAAGNHRQQNG